MIFNCVFVDYSKCNLNVMLYKQKNETFDMNKLPLIIYKIGISIS